MIRDRWWRWLALTIDGGGWPSKAEDVSGGGDSDGAKNLFLGGLNILCTFSIYTT